MNAGCARFDHALHQFESVEGSAETSLGIGHQRRKPRLPRGDFAFNVMNLVSALQGVVDASAEVRNAICRIEALVGIHGPSVIGIRGDLPSAYVNRLEPGLHLLDRLVAAHRAQRIDIRLRLQQIPQALGAHSRQRVLDVNRATKAQHIIRRIRTFHSSPAWIGGPLLGNDLGR